MLQTVTPRSLLIGTLAAAVPLLQPASLAAWQQFETTAKAGATSPTHPAGQAQEKAADEPQARSEVVITVTATRLPLRLSEIPAVAIVIDGDELRRRPALGLDEALRWTPQASLLRRTPGRAAHPTTQGLNLRGLSPSGTSRALVMVDGVPLTDPFGGWVYWNRVPRLALQAVEIVLGGGSAPFGSQALGGVVQLVTRRAPAASSDLRAMVGGGSSSTYSAALTFGHAFGRPGTGFLGSLETFGTGGYHAVGESERGAVDRRVASLYQAGRLRVDIARGLTADVDAYHEDRENGTPEQTNGTRGLGASLRWSGENAPGTQGWRLASSARVQRFRSRFSAVNSSRSGEFPVLAQHVPSTEIGLSASVWKLVAGTASLAAGGDWRHVRGRSDETVLAINLMRSLGGVQNLGGVYASAHTNLGPSVALDLSLRADGWQNRPLSAADSNRSASTLSPRAGLVWQAGPDLALHASAYRAFRAPTLNELYRGFRVGNVSTAANPELTAEELSGVEAGLRVDGGGIDGSTRWRVQGTAYINDLEGAVLNATVGEGNGLILRQRQNAGAATVRGLELSGQLAFGSRWRFDATYARFDSKIDIDPPGTPVSVVGNRLPQVPTYRTTISSSYVAPAGWNVLAAVHVTGEQFEDDRNELPLRAAATVDLGFDLPLGDQLRLGVQAQNLFDKRVEVGRTSVLLLGPPATLVATLSLRLDGSTR